MVRKKAVPPGAAFFSGSPGPTRQPGFTLLATVLAALVLAAKGCRVG